MLSNLDAGRVEVECDQARTSAIVDGDKQEPSVTGEDSIERPGDQQLASLSLGAQHRANWPEECHGRGQITDQDAWHQGSGELCAGAALKEACGQRRGEVAPGRCDPAKLFGHKAQLHEGRALATELRGHVDAG